MKLSVNEALIMSITCGAVILFCRAFPYIFFKTAPRSNTAGAFLDFVERIAPPAAMTVLAFNALGPSLKTLVVSLINIIMSVPLLNETGPSLAALLAAVLTALVHLWKRNPLLSIFGGTAFYMIMQRLI